MIKRMKSQSKIAARLLIENQRITRQDLVLVRRLTTPRPFVQGARTRSIDPRGGAAARSSLPLSVRPLPVFKASEVRT